MNAGEDFAVAIATAVLLAVGLMFGSAALADPVDPRHIEVVDGDTVRIGGAVVRLVGFDAPETGSRARCPAENSKGSQATSRLRQLVMGGGLDFSRVRCSCPTGTEGTAQCNYGRLCGILLSRGRNVGEILIAEGLARPYHCGPRACPPPGRWCGSLEDARRALNPKPGAR